MGIFSALADSLNAAGKWFRGLGKRKRVVAVSVDAISVSHPQSAKKRRKLSRSGRGGPLSVSPRSKEAAARKEAIEDYKASFEKDSIPAIPQVAIQANSHYHTHREHHQLRAQQASKKRSRQAQLVNESLLESVFSPTRPSEAPLRRAYVRGISSQRDSTNAHAYPLTAMSGSRFPQHSTSSSQGHPRSTTPSRVDSHNAGHQSHVSASTSQRGDAGRHHVASRLNFSDVGPNRGAASSTGTGTNAESSRATTTSDLFPTSSSRQETVQKTVKKAGKKRKEKKEKKEKKSASVIDLTSDTESESEGSASADDHSVTDLTGSPMPALTATRSASLRPPGPKTEIYEQATQNVGNYRRFIQSAEAQLGLLNEELRTTQRKGAHLPKSPYSSASLDEQLRDRIRIAEEEPATLAYEPSFRKLTSEEKNLVRTYRSTFPDPYHVINFDFNTDLHRKDVDLVCDNQWLNDRVIDYYTGLCGNRRVTEDRPDLPKVWTPGSHFLSLLVLDNGYTYSKVRRWTKRRKLDIFDPEQLDFMVLPVNISDTHWALCVINLRDKRFEYYDSMNGSLHRKIFEACAQYLLDEAEDKGKPAPDLNEWTKHVPKSTTPQQRNGIDCGVFVCKFIDYLTQDFELTFSQDNMSYFRKRMVVELLNKKLFESELKV